MFHLRHVRFSALILFLLLLIGSLMTSNAAQAGAANSPGWYWQNPLPQGNGLYSVSAVDEGTAWAAGRYGTIIKTSDGGGTWVNQESGTKADYMYDVCAVDADTAWAVGGSYQNRGVITRTTDGTNWGLQTPPSDRALFAVCALDANIAWAAGSDGTVIKTTDGSNWFSQDSGVNSDIYDISAADTDHVWAVGRRYDGTGHPVILRSDNGGSTWSHQDASVFLYGVAAVDANNAWAVGSGGTILATTDGGETWLPQDSGTTRNLKSVVSAGGTVAWAFGSGGTILATTDGVSWSPQVSGVSSEIGGSTFAGGTTAWAVGAASGLGSNSTFILKTTNGVNWNRQDSGSCEGLTDICACSPGVAWVARNQGLFSVARTTDGGATWNPCNTPLGAFIRKVSAVDENVAWAVGGRTVLTMTYIEVYRTVNAGATWETKYSLGLNSTYNQYGAFMAVEAVDAETAYVGGGYYIGPRLTPMYYIAVLMRTPDGGANWEYLAAGISTYDSISAVDADTFWVHGSGWDPMLVRRDGDTTVYQNYPSGLNLVDVSGVDDMTAWAVGDNGAIIKTVNGLDWVQQVSGTTVPLTSVAAVDANTAYACGSTGNQPGQTVMLKTDDGGATWTEQNAWAYRLHIVSAADRSNVWAVGDNGAIVHTTDGGVPGFRVAKVTPGSGVQNTVVSVTDLAGAYFEEGASVRIERGSTVIDATAVTVASADSITCTLNLAGAPLGKYDVVVRNPGGEEARLVAGFSVTNICGGGAGVSVGFFGVLMGLLAVTGAGRTTRGSEANREISRVPMTASCGIPTNRAQITTYTRCPRWMPRPSGR